MTTKHDSKLDSQGRSTERATTTKHGKPFAPERDACNCRQRQTGERVPSGNCPVHGKH